MAKIRYDIQPTKIEVGELCCGDFFIYHGNLYVYVDTIVYKEEFTEYDGSTTTIDNKVVKAVLMYDDDAIDSPNLIDLKYLIDLNYREYVEPVYVEITVKGYCK